MDIIHRISAIPSNGRHAFPPFSKYSKLFSALTTTAQTFLQNPTQSSPKHQTKQAIKNLFPETIPFSIEDDSVKMTESRDRLVRPLDLDAAFGRLRDGAIGDGLDMAPPVGTGWDRLGFGRRNFETPRNGVARGRGRGGTPSTPLFGSGGATAAYVRGRFRTPTTVNPRARNLYASPVVRRQSSTLPAWYPRRPLRDVTHIVRAMERTRSRLGDTEEQRNDRESEGALTTPAPQLRASMENYTPHNTPASSSRKKPLPPPSMLKVSKIIQSVANKPNNDDSEECLTPQKKLLAEIGTVEKLVMEELDKLKKTPSAKKVERQKRVHTLLSMR